jgi:hypothetical protein
MVVTITPFTIDQSCDCPQPLRHERGHIKEHTTITYWGIYIDDKYVSYTSNRELAERTKLWIERWLRDRL